MADIPVDRLTKAYIKIRDKRSELRKAYEAEDSVLKEKLETIQSALLDYCKDTTSTVSAPRMVCSIEPRLPGTGRAIGRP